MRINNEPVIRKMKLLRIGEVAEILDISRTHAYNLAKSGKLRTVQIGKRSIRVRLEALQEYIEKAESGGADVENG